MQPTPKPPERSKPELFAVASAFALFLGLIIFRQYSKYQDGDGLAYIVLHSDTSIAFKAIFMSVPLALIVWVFYKIFEDPD